jgi:hypothetical protein
LRFLSFFISSFWKMRWKSFCELSGPIPVGRGECGQG